MIQALQKYINEKIDFQQLHSLNESQTEIQPYLEKKHYTLCSENFHAIRIGLIWNRV